MNTCPTFAWFLLLKSQKRSDYHEFGEYLDVFYDVEMRISKIWKIHLLIAPNSISDVYVILGLLTMATLEMMCRPICLFKH